MTEYLTIEDLLAAAQIAVGNAYPQVRDAGLLESALARASATIFGEDAYPTVHTKAAALLVSLVRNHALLDGNKRLGWVATRLFYLLNERDLRAPEDDVFDLVMAVAAGALVDVDAIAARLEAWVV